MDNKDTFQNSDTVNHSSISRYLLEVPSAVIAGLIVFYLLDFILIPLKISFPISIIISVLIYGLTNYFSKNEYESTHRTENGISKHPSLLTLLFILGYIFFIIVSFLSEPNFQIFSPWSEISSYDLIKFVAAISLVFFMPGYAIVSTIDKRNEFGSHLKFLLSYFLSILLTGFTALIFSVQEASIFEIRYILISIYTLTLIQYIVVKFFIKNNFKFSTLQLDRFVSDVKRNSSKILIFSCLLALVILSTYYLYDGVIIGDQWFHHGRSLLFLSGSYSDLSLADAAESYPPFMSALLSNYFLISGNPSVNSFVAINFLNIMPTFAFYYFFSKWFPQKRKVAILAATLFMISSGFGWAHVITLAEENPVLSENSALELLNLGGIKSFDIRIPNTFINVGHPDITSPLQILMLPAGFFLLGLLREKINGKLLSYGLFSVVIAVGYFSHDEFGIFILCASFIPLIFKMQDKDSLYAALLTILTLSILVDSFFPGSYYTVREVFGIPIFSVYIFFIATIWALYASKWIHKLKIITNGKAKKENNNEQLKFIVAVVTISLVSFLYVFSFIVWDTASFDEVQIQTNDNGQRVVPWYLYPMRFGVVGLLGGMFLLSRFFKKTEKEIFIFVLLAIVAVLLSFYYDENRANRYLMVAMVGFASFLLYDLLKSRILVSRYLAKGALIGLVISTTSLSIFMYLGFSALALENPEFDEFHDSLPKRIFPSEISLLQFLRSNIDLRDNIALPSDNISGLNDSNLDGKLEAFVGIPKARLQLSPFVLGSSSPESFMALSDYSNIKYVIVPKKSNIEGISEFSNFVIQNSQNIYEDQNYLVLSIPKSSSAISEARTALVFQNNEISYSHLTSLTQGILEYEEKLEYDQTYFSFKENNYFPNENRILLDGLDIGTTLFSNPLENEINYIHARYKVISENGTNNHAGIIWSDGLKEYYTFLRPNKISLLSSDLGEFLSEPLIRENNSWYTLEVLQSGNHLMIFVNGELKIQSDSESIDSISNVGIRSYKTIAEFEPLEIRKIDKAFFENLNPDLKYTQYFPISLMVLSQINYDTFIDEDFSFFSKENIILTFDPTNFDKYLQFVKGGGNLIILNTEDDLKGGFGKLLSLRTGKLIEFDEIDSLDNMSIFGVSKEIHKNDEEVVIQSHYLNNNEEVAPFVLERNYGKGKIIFVNALGYYQGFSQLSNNHFSKIGSLSNLLKLQDENFEKSAQLQSVPYAWYIGNLNGDGNVNASSSSVIFPSTMEFLPLLNNNTKNLHEEFKNFYVDDFIVKNLKLYGKYVIEIKSTEVVSQPSSSQGNYIGLNFPKGFDMKVNLVNGSAEFNLDNQNEIFDIKHGQIEFKLVTSDSDETFHNLILMKKPEIEILGKINFDKLHSRHPTQLNNWLAKDIAVNADGELILNLDFVNKLNMNPLEFITYVNITKSDIILEDEFPVLKFPGDISYLAKKLNIEVPLEKSFQSIYNIVLGEIIISGAAYIFFLRYKKRI